jgi:hypothetical protein
MAGDAKVVARYQILRSITNSSEAIRGMIQS